MRTLETPRLVLRPLQIDDEAFYCGLYTDPETMRHIGAPWPVEEAQLAFQKALSRTQHVDDDHRYWTIAQRADGRLVGLIGWHRLPVEGSGPRCGDLGAILVSHAQGLGVSVDAGQALMAYAFGEDLFEELRTEHAIDHDHAAIMMSRLRFEQLDFSVDDPSMVHWRMSKDRWLELKHRTTSDSTPPSHPSETISARLR